MEENTKVNIVSVVIAILVISPLIGFFIYVPYRMNQDKLEMHERIKDNIVVSKPFVKVVGVNSDFISGAEDWYFVSALIEHESLGEQWIYDFRYNDATDELFYDDNIEGIGVIN